MPAGRSSGRGETRVLDRFAAGGCNRSRRSSLHRPKRMLHTRGLPGHQHCRRHPALRFTLLTNYSNKPSPPLLTPGPSGKTPGTGPAREPGKEKRVPAGLLPGRALRSDPRPSPEDDHPDEPEGVLPPSQAQDVPTRPCLHQGTDEPGAGGSPGGPPLPLQPPSAGVLTPRRRIPTCSIPRLFLLLPYYIRDIFYVLPREKI